MEVIIAIISCREPETHKALAQLSVQNVMIALNDVIWYVQVCMCHAPYAILTLVENVSDQIQMTQFITWLSHWEEDYWMVWTREHNVYSLTPLDILKETLGHSQLCELWLIVTTKTSYL